MGACIAHMPRASARSHLPASGTKSAPCLKQAAASAAEFGSGREARKGQARALPSVTLTGTGMSVWSDPHEPPTPTVARGGGLVGVCCQWQVCLNTHPAQCSVDPPYSGRPAAGNACHFTKIPFRLPSLVQHWRSPNWCAEW